MSTSPKPAKERKSATQKAERAETAAATPAPVKTAKTDMSADDAAFHKRLLEMTDYQLLAQQMSATRISRDTAHVKSGSAKAQLMLIEKEISRRALSPDDRPSNVRQAVASPKTGAKKRGD